MKDTFLFCKQEYDRLEEMLQAAVSRKEWGKAHDLQTEQGAYAAVMEHCFKNEFPYASSVYCTQENKPTWEPNWEEIPDKYKWVTVDKDGLVVAWKEKPSPRTYFWNNQFSSGSCTVYPKVDTEISSKHWKEMIYQRPQFKPDWGKAPEWAKRLLIDDDGIAWWSDGKSDYLDDGCWTSKRWAEAGIIKNAPKNCYERPQDEIDWSMAPKWANWIAIDKSIGVFAYEGEPYSKFTAWFADGRITELEKGVFSKEYLETPWRDSLRERPKGE